MERPWLGGPDAAELSRARGHPVAGLQRYAQQLAGDRRARDAQRTAPALARAAPVQPPWLLLGVAAALALQLAAMHWGRLQAILGTSPVEPAILLICLGGAALTIV